MKHHDATTWTQKMRRGNETGCVDKSRGGLFDIVNMDGCEAAHCGTGPRQPRQAAGMSDVALLSGKIMWSQKPGRIAAQFEGISLPGGTASVNALTLRLQPRIYSADRTDPRRMRHDCGVDPDLCGGVRSLRGRCGARADQALIARPLRLAATDGIAGATAPQDEALGPGSWHLKR
jgi:hypothetical protein